MHIKPIKTDSDYNDALLKLELLFDSPIGTPDSDTADILAVLIDEYENKQFPIEAPDPIEAIKIRMEELNLKQVDLAEYVGGANRVSEILHKKRKLTIDMIRKLTQRLELSASLLINDYKLVE